MGWTIYYLFQREITISIDRRSCHNGEKYSQLDKGHFVADTLDKTRGGKSQWKRLDDQMCKDTTLVIIIIISTSFFSQSNCFSFVLN